MIARVRRCFVTRAGDANLKRVRFLHFSMPVVVDVDRHQLSGLALRPVLAASAPTEPGDSRRDLGTQAESLLDQILREEAAHEDSPILTMAEISECDLERQLVVLSLRRPVERDSAKSVSIDLLAEAFLHAGSSRVIKSTCGTNGRIAATFMPSLYQAILAEEAGSESRDIASTLQRVKLEMLNSPQDGHPRRWAPFVLVGDPRSA